MDNLQYFEDTLKELVTDFYGFKPYYKWITFNTYRVVILGSLYKCFKPYYKWITFNTVGVVVGGYMTWSFKPYYKWITFNTITAVAIPQ